MPWVQIRLPLRLVSEANNTEHWTKKRKRKLQQQKMIGYLLNSQEKPPYFPVLVTLTRIAPRELDGDNLQMAFKSIRDALAGWLFPGKAPGQADSDKRIFWVYTQEKGQSKEYAVQITISAIDLTTSVAPLDETYEFKTRRDGISSKVQRI